MTDEQRTLWLAERKLGIGGSDIGAILGIDKYRTRYDVWADKTGIAPEHEDSPVMERGRDLEDVIAQKFAKQTGYNTYKPGMDIYVSLENPIFRASIDRFYLTAEDDAILECKAIAETVDEAKPYHWTQAQWYCGVCGLSEFTIAYLEIYTWQLKLFTFERNDAYIQEMQAAAVEFWNNHVLTNTPPEPMNGQDVAKMYAKHSPDKIIQAPPEIYNLYNELRQIKEQMKPLEAREEAIKDSLKLATLDGEALYYNDQCLATYKGTSSAKFDAKAFQKAEPELYTQYLIESTTRRFLPKY